MKSIVEHIQKYGFGTLPTDLPTAKEKILDFLNEIKEDDPRNWATIKTIAKGSKVPSMYVRSVIETLCDNKLVESGWRQKKLYFRIKEKS